VVGLMGGILEMKINAVFEGGGVKAIGLAGAVTEAERRGFKFYHVAGTSSGSIVAALLAAGYTGNELRSIIEATPFTSFLKQSWIHQIRWVGPAVRVFIKKGLYSGEALEQWIHKLLAAKGIRTFGDLKPNQLRIIASDISQSKLMVLPDDLSQYGIDSRKFPVSKAIRMSTSIPYFFDPVMLRKRRSGEAKGEPFHNQFVYVVDGGILSNFPLWIFDKEKETEDEKGIPAIGFQLVGRSSKEPRTISGPISMFQALFSTMMDAHDERYIEESSQFRTIKIPTVGVQVTQFNISKEKSEELFQSGVKAASKYFDKWSISAYNKNCGLYLPKTIV
jgi:NTE family protein